MSTYTLSATPITVVIGRPWSLPLTWQGNPSGLPIDTTGMTLVAAMTWLGQASPVLPTVAVRDDPSGTATLTLAESDTAAVPEGQLSMLRITYTDTGGATHDYDIPIKGARP